MQKPLNLVLKNYEDRGGIVAAVVQEKIAKIEKICPKLISCHVLIEKLTNLKHHNHSYHIRIELQVPGHPEVVIIREPKKGEIQSELLTTQVREAFIAGRRQIEEIIDRQQGHVKSHAVKQVEEVEEEEI
ncbi:MAG: hypothetical protein HQL23_02865 [Candidatus Omnitrophica bacterium]|nr:hypothetical protein [Candidatus Omnitrophota bacterium]